MLARQQTRALKGVSTKGLAARPAVANPRRRNPAPTPGSAMLPKQREFTVRSAAKEEIDFDKFLIILATKWEDSNNKAVVAGYVVAAVSAFFFSEWLIHLPVLNYLLGFPIQLVGLVTVPWLVTRWVVDSKDWYDDVSGATGYIVGKLPYLEAKADAGEKSRTSG